ncbi:MAG: T9SS type A sorting domain-containing protein, partial [Prolixibacteraceae bacterium]|nr:T9SS type A sorting domain-containing protein [Prolixibacteraceae bacterium]
NFLYIENSTGIQKLEVFNSVGQKVISENYYGGYSIQLAIDQLTKGLYIVQFTSNNLKTHVSKFIKK